MPNITMQIQDLTVEAGSGGSSRRIVHGVSISIAPGEVVALIGESGAGKTTIALSALGYSRSGTNITGGSVTFDSIDVLNQTQEQRNSYRGGMTAYIAQSASASLNPSMNIGEQIVESLMLHGMVDRAAAERRAEDMLTTLQLPEPRKLMQRRPFQISGGQQQRVMIGIAMACRPSLLVFDEPTTALDVTTQVGVLRTIKQAIAQQKDLAAIYVSHDLAVVAQVATRIIVLKDGHIVDEGTTEQILTQPGHPYTRELLNAVKSIPATFHQSTTNTNEEILTLDMVTASYIPPSIFDRWLPPKLQVLHDINLTLMRGETLSLVGESGSGKSTLARVIAGLHAPLAGSIRLDGKPVVGTSANRSKEQLRRIQIVFQSPEQALNPNETVGDAIDRVLRFYFERSLTDRVQRVSDLLELVALPAEFAKKYPHQLSGGQRQRVAIARAFAADPDIIICDEFLSALDTVVASRILELMDSIQKKMGVSYIFISHDLATVANISDRVAVMHFGSIVEQGRAEDVFRAPKHPYTTMLLNSVPQLRTDWLDKLAPASGNEGSQPKGGGTVLSFSAEARFQ